MMVQNNMIECIELLLLETIFKLNEFTFLKYILKNFMHDVRLSLKKIIANITCNK